MSVDRRMRLRSRMRLRLRMLMRMRLRMRLRSRVVAGDERGFSVIELLVALAIISLLGSSLIAIVGAGSDAFRHVLSDRDAQAEARIAVSYVTVKLRQNDARGRVSIEKSDSEEYPGNVLKIIQPTGTDSLFIYFVKADGADLPGQLVEKYSTAPGVGDPHGANVIAEISGFSVSYADDDETGTQISVAAHYMAGGAQRSLESLVTLRAP